MLLHTNHAANVVLHCTEDRRCVDGKDTDQSNSHRPSSIQAYNDFDFI